MGGNSGLIPIVIVIVIVIVIMCHFFTNCFGVWFDIRLIFRTFTNLPPLLCCCKKDEVTK